MQNNSNREYKGLKELLSLEEHMPNYNSYIMSLCSELVENKNQVVDFGAGIGTLSMIYREKAFVNFDMIQAINKSQMNDILDINNFADTNDISTSGSNQTLTINSNPLPIIN